MKVIKKILLFPIEVIKLIMKGFSFWCLLLSKGFYFYGVLFFSFLKKIFGDKKVLNWGVAHFKKRQKQPEFFLLLMLWVVAFGALFNILYVEDRPVTFSNDSNLIDDKSETEEGDQSTTVESKPGESNFDNNLFRKYAKTSLSDVNINELKKENSDTVAWLSVDGTNINYPIVQTSDNDYYLNHSYDNSYKKSGWTFMDFRNDSSMNDQNTIFYGHNLLNKTGFGSVSNIFTDQWYKNSSHTILVITASHQYLYRVFSVYYINPEVYYLQTNLSERDYLDFLNNLKGRSIYSFNEVVGVGDKIITLSTCTEDNQGRKVVHAKLIEVR